MIVRRKILSLKKISSLIFLSTVIFFSGEIFGQSVEEDTQLWTITTVEFPFDKENKKLSGYIFSDLRTGENISSLNDLRFGFGAKYQATKSIKIQPSYVFRVQRIPDRPNRIEHRLRFDVTPRKKFKRLTLDNRNRLEHRIRTGGRDDRTFYRNRTRVRVPVRRNDKTIFTPFISNDTWFEIQNAKVFRNDAIGGINRKINDNFSAEAFYRYRQTFQPTTETEKVFGIRLSIDFKIE